MAKQTIKKTKYKIRKSKKGSKNCPVCGKFMGKKKWFLMKFDFTKEEYEEIKDKLMLNEELSVIFMMKIKGYSITKMSMELNMSERTINRRIKQLKKKITKVL